LENVVQTLIGDIGLFGFCLLGIETAEEPE